MSVFIYNQYKKLYNTFIPKNFFHKFIPKRPSPNWGAFLCYNISERFRTPAHLV